MTGENASVGFHCILPSTSFPELACFRNAPRHNQQKIVKKTVVLCPSSHDVLIPTVKKVLQKLLIARRCKRPGPHAPRFAKGVYTGNVLLKRKLIAPVEIIYFPYITAQLPRDNGKDVPFTPVRLQDLYCPHNLPVCPVSRSIQPIPVMAGFCSVERNTYQKMRLRQKRSPLFINQDPVRLYRVIKPATVDIILMLQLYRFPKERYPG